MSNWHDPTHSGGSIFVNKQNLLFAMPLISVCSIYAYFKFVPLNIGLSLIGAGIVIYKTVTGIKSHAVDKKEKKIANMDESFLEELAADELQKEKTDKKKEAKKKQKAGNKAKSRIAAEKKKAKAKANKNGGGNRNEEEDDDDDTDVSTFVTRKSNKKRN
mmetsp:Transcript_5289/g.5050  ORF Transcript_5289/g.5050 Transcript_5289/m.5050 type:complete len:160 (-) Transcript_5289:135-614(-)|eukprot:CAMPEP_0197743752 /NCGR_PEP_ID=MMETSP1435-20131217/36126_1 /TAXON_ID=426625 /ORGANISM="Chaetoceros brevis, Strain CCMP164" /LENGTH=159 /DNA_ID=CAMNT_0043334821 /DNA_START=28 /DNA_END=507 /DNA_ORIENTATION=+